MAAIRFPSFEFFVIAAIALGGGALTFSYCPAPSVATPPVARVAEPLPVAPEQAPAPAAPSIESVEYHEIGRITVVGKAGAGGAIKAYLNGTLVRDIAAKAGERFVLALDALLPAGRYRLRIEAVEIATGRVTSRVETPFARDPGLLSFAAESLTKAALPSLLPPRVLEIAAPNPPASDDEPTAAIVPARLLGGVSASGPKDERGEPKVVIIRPGDTLWSISQQRYGSGLRYPTIYQANRDQIRDPDLIFPHQIFVVPLPEPAKTIVQRQP